jgi:hypothetical protein
MRKGWTPYSLPHILETILTGLLAKFSFPQDPANTSESSRSTVTSYGDFMERRQYATFPNMWVLTVSET